MKKGRIVVGGILFYFPVPGVAWQHLHYLIGLRNLGWDVHYIEDGYWHSCIQSGDYSTASLAGKINWSAAILDRFGFKDRWHYHAQWEDKSFGLDYARARELLRGADVFLNICGSNILTDDHMKIPRRVYMETDPVEAQIQLAQKNQKTLDALRNHTSLFTFGENVGTPACTLSTGGFTWLPTRQPVVIDEWAGAAGPGNGYTTVGNWDVSGKDVVFEGKTYHWRKSLEFVKLRDLPSRAKVPFRLAMKFREDAPREMMESHGWGFEPDARVVDDLDVYRDFIRGSRGEFTVAKEQNIVFQTGWFSDRGASYLAAGRPVINQDTGFARNIPVGNGLFSFSGMEDCVQAFAAIESDYARHSRAAAEIGREYFGAEKVLSSVLDRAGGSK